MILPALEKAVSVPPPVAYLASIYMSLKNQQEINNPRYNMINHYRANNNTLQQAKDMLEDEKSLIHQGLFTMLHHTTAWYKPIEKIRLII